MMLAAVLLVAQATMPVATCCVPEDPQQRTWCLEGVTREAWLVGFTSKSLDQPRIELPVATARPALTGPTTAVSFAATNGGRRVEWIIEGARSTLDLHVNHGLEVNVEHDLDHAVEAMNTDGAIAVTCTHQGGSREPGAGNRAPG